MIYLTIIILFYIISLVILVLYKQYQANDIRQYKLVWCKSNNKRYRIMNIKRIGYLAQQIKINKRWYTLSQFRAMYKTMENK
jgi:hypothetical protein